MDDLKLLESMPPRGKNRLSNLERMAMLHGIDRGLSPSRISAKWKMRKSTVRMFRRSLYDDFLSIFRLRVVQRTGNGVFQCRLCGEPRAKLSAVQRHLLGHFFAPEIAENIDLNEMPRFL